MEPGKFNITNWMADYERYPINTIIRACVAFGGMTETTAKRHIEAEIRAGTIYVAVLSTTNEPLYQKNEIAIATRNQDKEVPKRKSTEPVKSATKFSNLFNPSLHKIWI